MRSREGEAAQADHEKVMALFPNAIPVTGIKHIADNLLGGILEALPQPLGLSDMT